MERRETRELLREFVRNSSEVAFRELVTNYTGLVYAAALRMVDPDVQAAEDVAQVVFTDLARMAHSLPEDILLGGWLHRHACFVASKMIRRERRRQARENEAAHMALNSAPDGIAAAKPVLDDAIDQLEETDRQAILLRFFEALDFRAVGEALGASEDGARMRVNRALDKLHALLRRRGIATTAAALSTALPSHAVGLAPAGLAAKLSAGALAGALVPSAATATTTHAIAMTMFQKTAVGLALVLALTTSVYQTHQATRLGARNRTLEQQREALSGQIDRLQAENERLQAAQAHATANLNASRLRELLRLRGEVARLRRQQHELATATPQRAGAATSAAPEAASAGRPAPFKVQLLAAEAGGDTESLTNQTNGEVLQAQKNSLMDHTAIQSATVTRNPATGNSEIGIELCPEGKELFAAITRENVNQRLAIVVDGHLYAAPVIRGEIANGKAVVSGNFTEEEAQALAAKINESIPHP